MYGNVQASLMSLILWSRLGIDVEGFSQRRPNSLRTLNPGLGDDELSTSYGLERELGLLRN